jgi:hypothetical protein
VAGPATGDDQTDQLDEDLRAVRPDAEVCDRDPHRPRGDGGDPAAVHETNAAHPTYQAMIELGRAQKTIFVARYLRSRALQREINDGLNVIESWNRANSIIFYGKNSEIASNRRDEQEMSVLCLRIRQAAMVYVNVLMIQDILADPDWDGVLTPDDERGLTPLFWSHVLPYGEVKLNMNTRLALGG